MSQAHTPSAPLAEVYDVAVVGGGINGVGIAADAAGRGLSVFLCEQHDLAQHTSSASSKLIHGGLRYLEHYEFRLVREALAEREVLLAKAPHIVKPLRFVLPHRPHLRPAWMIRAGLFLYDHLGKREKLPASRGLRFTGSSPLKAEIRRGFEYSDCAVDDARLVVLNAISAREHGAHVHTRTRCVSARRSKGLWHLHLEAQRRQPVFDPRPRPGERRRPLGGALHPGRPETEVALRYPPDPGQPHHRAEAVRRRARLHPAERRPPHRLRHPLSGPFHHDRHHRSRVPGDPAKVAISEEETAYLLQVVNAHFKQQLAAADILHSFAGVRPLCDDESDEPSAITRDYTLSLSAGNGEPPLLSVFGGKLTTYRKLAESALAQLQPFFANLGPAWTAKAPLPGGEQMQSVEALTEQLANRYAWLDRELALRWARTYGTRVWRLLDGVNGEADLGEHLGGGLYAREVDYLCKHEWAQDAEDILWRRSKLGLFLSPSQQVRLGQYLQSEHPHRPRVHAA